MKKILENKNVKYYIRHNIGGSETTVTYIAEFTTYEEATGYIAENISVIKETTKIEKITEEIDYAR